MKRKFFHYKQSNTEGVFCQKTAQRPYAHGVLPKIWLNQYNALVLLIVLANLVMNKAQLAQKVADRLGIANAAGERALECVIEEIINSLKAGDAVSIAGLGIFEAKMRAARTARNPRSGEPIQVPAMRVPKFRAAKALKEAVR